MSEYDIKLKYKRGERNPLKMFDFSDSFDDLPNDCSHEYSITRDDNGDGFKFVNITFENTGGALSKSFPRGVSGGGTQAVGGVQVEGVNVNSSNVKFTVMNDTSSATDLRLSIRVEVEDLEDKSHHTSPDPQITLRKKDG